MAVERAPSLAICAMEPFGCSKVSPISRVIRPTCPPLLETAHHPAVDFPGAGSNKTAWIASIVVALVIGLGFFRGGFYLLFTRHKVRRHEQVGS